MNNFVFQSPTKIIFGKNAEEKAGEEIKRFGGRTLLHYGGGSIKKNGLYDRVTASLRAAGIFFIELGGVKPNPQLDLVYEGIRLCRENNLDSVLAVGGGSVIDSSKAIGMGVMYDGDVWDFYTGKSDPLKTLPVGVVLTIAAAGSELSRSSVISNEKTGRKFGTRTDVQRTAFAIMNPELTFTVSRFQTACGGVDIMAHVFERYFTLTKFNDLTDRLCEATMKTVIKHLPIALKNPADYNARAELMLAGTIAHNDQLGMGREQDWGSHKLSHEMSSRYGSTHGAALGVIFPAWMKYVYKQDVGLFVQFATRVWDVEAGGAEETALEGIRRYEQFVKSTGLPTSLKELGARSEDIEAMADSIMSGVSGQFGGFKKIGKNDIIEILKLADR